MSLVVLERLQQFIMRHCKRKKDVLRRHQDDSECVILFVSLRAACDYPCPGDRIGREESRSYKGAAYDNPCIYGTRH